MQFVYPALTIGFLVALAPLLIHLINMLRHRRVKWAAMDFLLQSYRKHRKWIWLKQLLLLLTRMAAIALIVAMLAQWVSREQWFSMLAGNATHHYVVLDDSFSMDQRHRGTTAFDKARDVVGKIASQATAESGGNPQKLTLLRYSMVTDPRKVEDEGRLDEVADFNATPLDGRFDELLEQRGRTVNVTQLAVGPRNALQLVRQLIGESKDEQAQLYLLSDFRSRQWERPVEIRNLLTDIQRAGAQVHLVDCAMTTEENLGITEMTTSDDTHAAGVPFFVNVTVTNFGSQPVRDVQLKVRSVFHDPERVEASRPETLEGQVDELPLDHIEQIGPRESVTRRVQVYFPKSGSHVVEAVLPDDAVETDNRRWCVVQCPEVETVLVIDGTPDQSASYYLGAAFAPGNRAKTGISPVVEAPRYLDDVKPERLAEFSAVYVLDVPRFNDVGLSNLRRYVEDGGGVCFFAGPNVLTDYYTQRLYDEGRGIFPLPLAGDDLLASELVENNPDVRLEPHPIFDAMLGERNPLIRAVTVERYLSPPEDWTPPQESTVKVLASLRNLMPLVIEKRCGEGRVVAVLTTVTPTWNNWALNPSFVVAVLRTQAYLAQGQRAEPGRRVGEPLDLQLETDRFRDVLVFVAPGRPTTPRVAIECNASRTDMESPLMTFDIGNQPRSRVKPGETDRGGVYEAWPTTNQGEVEVRRWALNVDGSEGAVEIVGRGKLVEDLRPVEVLLRHVDEFQYDAGRQKGFNRGLLLMCLLIPLLLGEQVLAYLAGYHPPRGATT